MTALNVCQSNALELFKDLVSNNKYIDLGHNNMYSD